LAATVTSSEQDFSEETHWEKAAKTRMGKYLTKTETQFIQNSIDTSSVSTVMDVGAEAGRFSHFPKETTTVISIDIDSYGLKRLKRKARHVNVILADARKIPLQNETLDAILMIEVLDYIPELYEALAECHRTLKPNASLIVSFGNKSSLKSKLRETRGKSYTHSYQSVMRSLVKTGFKVKKRMGYNWLPFGRTSENPLIPILTMAERLFGFRKIPRYSPWIIIHATKPN